MFRSGCVPQLTVSPITSTVTCQSHPAESRGVELRPSAGILLSLSRTQAAAVAVAPYEWPESCACAPPWTESIPPCLRTWLIPPCPLSQIMHLHLMQLPGYRKWNKSKS